MSMDWAYSKATAWRAASSSTSSASFSYCAVNATANAHASSSACLNPTTVCGRELMT
jgi:hypothetical protein